MMPQMIIPSETADDIRSRVTAPPIRIPGIQSGKGIRGSVNKVVPGIGTPIRTPMTVLIARIHNEIFIVQLKLLPHGASSRFRKTTTATAPTQTTVKTGLSNRVTETVKPIAQIHHVSGCSDSFVIDYFLINALGVAISKPHSLAGYPAIPQINPELSPRTFAT